MSRLSHVFRMMYRVRRRVAVHPPHLLDQPVDAARRALVGGVSPGDPGPVMTAPATLAGSVIAGKIITTSRSIHFRSLRSRWQAAGGRSGRTPGSAVRM